MNNIIPINFISLTEMGRPYGKRLEDFLDTTEAKQVLKDFADGGQVVLIGDSSGRQWGEPLLASFYAGWLDPAFDEWFEALILSDYGDPLWHVGIDNLLSAFRANQRRLANKETTKP